jgi:DNA modification methylase
LRDYGTATWEGGEDGCDHKPERQKRNDRPLGAFHGGSDEGNGSREPTYKDVCPDCGAVRIDSQLGLEPTPEQYVENMVAVFREVRRVLRSDGTVWLNLGDTYSGNGGYAPDAPSNVAGSKQSTQPHALQGIRGDTGLRSKNLVGIPWRVAFALQADGWYLRSDIIWSKPNPMPESVTDRPTKSHEYVFLLSKSPRYYFDADVVREPHQDRQGIERFTTSGGNTPEYDSSGHQGWVDGGGMKMRPGPREYNSAGRNIRTVWNVATQPYPGAHFAVFPEKLIEPCILAGTSERGVCPECGKPWRRVTESTTENRRDYGSVDKFVDLNNGRAGDKTVRTLSWIPSCAHDAEPVGAVVLDPFGGSGTTARVANRLSRRAVLIDLNPDYLKQQMDRNRDLPLGLGA